MNSVRAELFVNRFFALLSWPTEAPAAFCSTFEPLGVSIDLSDIADGFVRVQNRMQDIEHEVGLVVKSGALSPALARVLHDWLLFARSQAFGRIGAAALHALGRVADSAAPTLGLPVRPCEAWSRCCASCAPRAPVRSVRRGARRFGVHRRRLRAHRPTRAAS